MKTNSIDIRFIQYGKVFFNNFPENNIFYLLRFYSYEPAEWNFHIPCMSRTFPFNWLHSFFTRLFLYHKEVTKSRFQHVAFYVTVFLQMKFGDVQFYCKLKYANLVEWNLILTDTIHSTKISWNFAPKLNGSVRSNQKNLVKTGTLLQVRPVRILVEWITLSYHVTRSWSLCLYFVTKNVSHCLYFFETSVTVNNNSPIVIQDYVHPDDQTQPTSSSVGFFLMECQKSTVIFPMHPCISFLCG